MSITTETRVPAPRAAIDPMSFKAPSFAKLAQLELRKSVDTRAGRALLIVTASGVLLTAVIMFLVAQPDSKIQLAGVMSDPGLGTFAYMVFPMVAIMTMTSEWSARAALVTFTQVPSRAKILWAKVVANLVSGVLMFAFILLVGVIWAYAKGAASGQSVGFDRLGEVLLSTGLTFLIAIVFGLALGSLLSSTAIAIVVYFVAPLLVMAGFGVATGLEVAWLRDSLDYINWQMNTALLASREFDGHVPQIITTIAVWVVIPAIAGFIATLKREVK